MTQICQKLKSRYMHLDMTQKGRKQEHWEH